MSEVFTCGTSTVEDHDGNSYNTVKVGNQCWTKENMRCTTSPNGYNLREGSWYTKSKYQAYYYDYTSSDIPLEDRGMLYKWPAVLDTVFSESDNINVSFKGRQGICPKGWHVPTNAEWTELTAYVSNNYACDGNSANNSKALATDAPYWNTVGGASSSCAIKYNPTTTNNATGFSAVPAGNWANNFRNSGDHAYFWSSTTSYNNESHSRTLNGSYESVHSTNDYKDFAFSVRCIKD